MVATIGQFLMTVTLGLNQTAEAYRDALRAGAFKISDGANDLMCNPAFMVSTELVSVDLLLVTAAELGFENGATGNDIYERALSLGLELCPPEVGPALRLAYREDQLEGLVGMEPVDIGVGDQSWVFSIGHDGAGRWLGAYWDNPGGRRYTTTLWDADINWVFVRPNQS